MVGADALWGGLRVAVGVVIIQVLQGRTMRAELIGHFEPCMTDIYLQEEEQEEEV